MPDLQNCAVRFCKIDQTLAGSDGLSQWLFDKHRDSVFEKLASDVTMQRCRHDDRRRIDFAHHVPAVGDPSSVELLGDWPTDLFSGLGNGDKFDARQSGNNPSVMSSQSADANNHYSKIAHDEFSLQ
jgi:hypothetical protein